VGASAEDIRLRGSCEIVGGRTEIADKVFTTPAEVSA
jgi:hypothetical protein